MDHDAKLRNELVWGSATVIYLVLGFFFNLWHPGWILFLLAGLIITYLNWRSKQA